jgi:hypothetical protein
MYAYAVQLMMLGMRLNMVENQIYLEPRIPDSLRNNIHPVEFEQSIRNVELEQRYKFIVDPNHEKITVYLPKNKVGRAPEILSNSYSIRFDET